MANCNQTCYKILLVQYPSIPLPHLPLRSPAETIEKIRATTTAAMKDPRTIDKLRKAAGKPHTEETKETIRQKMKNWHSDRRAELQEARDKRKEAKDRDKSSDSSAAASSSSESDQSVDLEAFEAKQAEMRSKAAASMRKRWQDPEYRCEKAVIGASLG